MSRSIRKVAVIGHFGEGKNLLNGQTVKTKIIAEELKKQLGQSKVLQFDTHGGRKTLLKAPLYVWKALRESKNVIILPAHNGLRIFGRLLPFFRRFFKDRKIHYVVIGGWMPQMLESKKSLTKALKKFDGIYVETNTMKIALEKQGFENIFVMPNCKPLAILSESELVYPEGIPLRLCTFSRVMKEKGIETAVNVIRDVNKKLGYTAYSLDIYGQVDNKQIEWFENLKNQFPEYIRYGGLVSFDKSVEVLKGYFALLFPTYYEGEGFAGTLIDAYSAGVPVIASDWKYNSELVNENVGYIFPTGDQTAFIRILKNIAINPSLVLSKKKCCIEEANKYRIERAIQVLIRELERE